MAVSHLIENLKEYDGSVGQFFFHLLSSQCFLGPSDEGAIFRCGDNRQCDILSLYPLPVREGVAPGWLTPLVGQVRKGFSEGGSTVILVDESTISENPVDKGHIIVVPVKLADISTLFAAFYTKVTDKVQLKTIQERLELTALMLGLSEGRQDSQKPLEAINRLQRAMEIMSATNRQHKFGSVSMALCNEIATQCQCERVSFGVLEGRYVKLKAMSHTEHFSRKMEIAQDIESAMEECLDQDIEVLYPVGTDMTYISRAAEKLSQRNHDFTVLSLPMRREKKVLGVITLERPGDKPFSFEEIETLRLTCELITSRLMDRYVQDRWFGARLAAWMREGLSHLVGPKYTWTKVIAFLVCLGLMFLIFAKGEYKVEATFVVEATEKQIIAAPFDGFIKAVNVEIGDAVVGDETVLAELDTSELLLMLAASKAEKFSVTTEYNDALSRNMSAEASIAQAKIDKADAQINLLTYQIEQAGISSPLSGTVVVGDLKRQIGAPYKTGDILFEVTPLESLRAELLIPEDQIADVALEQEGYLATASFPADRIRFLVERIEPIAEVAEQRNVFRVRAQMELGEEHGWMRPGMEGVAKVHAGKRRYAWIWTRKVVNWVRMKLWI
ncbi:MAG: HlyD family efflux transporter periplasmic adaptor subunit [Planctomycetes bacterium]|nr:HlyD family efflux transporter periplasmic adaptor subunit [Planctomycetota bacterium]